MLGTRALLVGQPLPEQSGRSPLLSLTLWSITQKDTKDFKAVRVLETCSWCRSQEAGEAFINKLAQPALVSTEVTIYRAQ